ncbi:MAG: helix-turn-helix transcriptional regulator [Armatimonadetes bacterium]|nr:helix-turn-helix transcriptional regulator [Armatimonadota bacterium]
MRDDRSQQFASDDHGQATAHRCPFHPDAGTISLSEIPGIVRAWDRPRFKQALQQLERALTTEQELDEARGQALTFIALVTSATLEAGGTKGMHKVQLEAARAMETATSHAEIASIAVKFVTKVVPLLFQEARDPHVELIDVALLLIDKHYSKPLTDADIARAVGLSTSHFRHLFKEATGLPFHRYLLGLRLEKAHAQMGYPGVSVTEVAESVGFACLSHFSRAFTKRFSVRPSEVRKSLEGLPARA